MNPDEFADLLEVRAAAARDRRTASRMLHVGVALAIGNAVFAAANLALWRVNGAWFSLIVSCVCIGAAVFLYVTARKWARYKDAAAFVVWAIDNAEILGDE